MTYIYDILLNFNDDNDILEFFEWQDSDYIEHIKKIPIKKITSTQMQEICDNRIRVSKDFLDSIKNQTVSYRNKKEIKYASLFTDNNKVIALEFNSKGVVISSSNLLLDEEDDVIDESEEEQETTINYQILAPYNKVCFLTRSEKHKRNFLLKELNSLYSENNLDKFNYLYREIFPKDKLSFEERLKKIIKDINENYNSKYNDLYEVVYLSYSNK